MIRRPVDRARSDQGLWKVSHDSYPNILAERLGARLTDLTTSGATTAHVLRERAPHASSIHWLFMLLPGRGSHPTQISRVPADADLVTITIGGNDVGYIASCFGLAAVEPWAAGAFGFLARRLRTTILAAQPDYEKATAAMVEVVEAVRAKAPNAHVVLVDYAKLFSDHSKTNSLLPISAEGISHLRKIGDCLEQCFAQAAERSGATLVKASEVTKDHALGSSEPWVAGAQPDGAAAWHPKAEAMQAIADELHRVL